MRILFLSNLYPPHHIGGYEQICASVNRAMKARGHETLVLTSNHRVEGADDTAIEGVSRSLRLHGFFGHPWLGIRQLKDLELHNNYELHRVLNEFKPDIIHVFNLGGISKSLIHTIERLGVPAVYFVSDHWVAQSLEADVWLDWWNRKATSAVQAVTRGLCHVFGLRKRWDQVAPTRPAKSASFRRIYFCSRFLKEQAVQRGRGVRHGEVIHNAVDIARFAGTPAPLGKSCSRFLFVGRLTPEKGILTVLDTIKILGPEFCGTLTICGRGEEAFEQKLKSIVREHLLPVTFILADSGRMPAVYADHDALIFASEWEEPFALTPLEAMACGLPVISTTTGGSAELFRDGQNALTFEPGNSGSLAEQIRRLMVSPELRLQIAMEGQRQVREEYSEDRVMDQIEEYLGDSLRTWDAADCNETEPNTPIHRYPQPSKQGVGLCS